MNCQNILSYDGDDKNKTDVFVCKLQILIAYVFWFKIQFLQL